MMNKLFFSSLIQTISENENVLSIGKSGGKKLPENSESDIDVFVFCDEIPDVKSRQAIYGALDENIEIKISENGVRFWGVCDFVNVNQDEICLMYFTVTDMDNEIESVLNGSRLKREDEYFYPTGRCATILSMHILYERNCYIANMKEKLSVYPEMLAKNMIAHHTKQINDAEDFERAVLRQDILFYHFTLESAIDHFLQGLFALNHCFFPSRKRSIQYIKGFDNKPHDCSERLLRAIELGSKAETLEESYAVWCSICNDFKGIVNQIE